MTSHVMKGIVSPRLSSKPTGMGHPPVTGRSVQASPRTIGYSAAKVIAAISYRAGGAGGA